MQSLLLCSDTVVLRVVPKEERDRVSSLLSAWVSYTSHQPKTQKLPETRPVSPWTEASGDPPYPTLAHQPIQFARQINEVRTSTRLLAVGVYPTGSDTEESELPTAAIESGADKRTQLVQPVDCEDKLDDELPPSVECLDEGTGEIVLRFKDEEEAQTQEQVTAEGGAQAHPTTPSCCDHEPTNTRCLTDQEATASDAGFNRQGQVASIDLNFSSVKITCPRCHFVLENISENNMAHLTTDDTSMGDDDVPGLPEDSEGAIDINYAGDELMDNRPVTTANRWIEQISGVAGLRLSDRVPSREGRGSSASSASDIEMGGIENPPETIQDRSLEPQPSLHSRMTPGRLDTDGLPASFNMLSGSDRFSLIPSTLRVDASANIGPHSSALSGTSPAQFGLAYSDGEVPPSDVSMTSPAEATPSRGVITLRSVPREATPLAESTLPSLKRSLSEDDHFMREMESPLAAKRCRRQSPERNRATVNSRQGRPGRSASAARSLARRWPSRRDLQSRRNPATAGVEPGNYSNIQAENDIGMQADDMQEDIGVPDSPLSDLESYTSPVLAAAETNPPPSAEMQTEATVQEKSETQRRPGDSRQSDVTRLLAETNSGSVLNLRADTGATLQEDTGVQGSLLSDLVSYTSPVLAAVRADFTEAEAAVEIDMQEEVDAQREPIRDIQSDVIRLLSEIDSDYVLNMPAYTGFEIREDEGAMSDPLHNLQGSPRPALAEIATTSLSDTQMETNNFKVEELLVDGGMANWEAENTNTTQSSAVLDKGKGKAAINLEAEPESDVSAEVDLEEFARQTDPKEWRRLTNGGIPRASPARRMGAVKRVRASPRPIATPSSMFTQGPLASSSSAAAAAELSNSTAVAARQTLAGSKASSSSGVRKPGIWGKLKDAMKERKPSMQQKRREAERAATGSAVESPSEVNDNVGNVERRSPGSSSNLENKEN
ncbi:hypothetical protein NQ176_g1103 [Zarea fungicola]|uniref:Uncharacterized protein n=1 Tax=Zarea fungicola TaxID=93591 RepID=A0ACC1NWI9_9HYPO|nr:hypothetical protein NQ176_g1103 [Lecanicillium fungicola]